MIKRSVFTVILLVAICLVGVLLPAMAAEPEELASGTCGDNLSWVITDDGTLTITGTGMMEDFDFLQAPWIHYYADIQSVVIDHGVTGIGAHAFVNCENLKCVTIPESLTYIGESAFEMCAVTDVYIADIGAWCQISFGNGNANPLYARAILYLNHEPVSELVIPKGVTKIGDYAFRGGGNFTSITIPDSVTDIGHYAFSACVGITEITLPDGLKSIGASAFEYCTGLTNIKIPDGVTSIGASAFSACRKLERVELPDSVTVIGISAFRGCESLKSIRLPDGIKRIADHTFEGCRSLRVVVIPKKVYEIAGGAFSDCKELWHILFKGTKSQWKRVTVATHRGDSSARVEDAVKHFTCTGDEVTDLENKICTICQPCSHKWDSGVVTKEPTCAEEGKKTLTCTKCDETKTESIPKTDTHSFGEWTRADANSHKRSCAGCKMEETAAHIWNDGEVTKAATCTVDGEKTYTCTDCSATMAESVVATGHSYGDWVLVKAPTTEETGLKERVCGGCGVKGQRELAKLKPSPTEPIVPTEPVEPTAPQTRPIEPVEKQPGDPSAVLFVVIGVVGALVISGVAALFVLKKKRK